MFYHNMSGHLRVFENTLEENSVINKSVVVGREKIVGDTARLPTMYVESGEELEKGHVVEWKGTPSSFLTTGERKTTFDGSSGYHYAYSKVGLANSYSGVTAGVVIDKVAQAGDSTFTHSGIETTHQLPQDVENVYRVARDVCLAWVFADEHDNELEGVYKKYINGEEQSEAYILQMVSTDTFHIAPSSGGIVADNTEIEALRERLDALTSH